MTCPSDYEFLRNSFTYHNRGYLVWKIEPGGDGRIGTAAGSLRPDDYIDVTFGGQKEKLHRLIFLYHHGYLPDVVDHIDRDRMNNRIENLRPSDKSSNAINSDKSRSFCGFKGVTYITKRRKYKAQITKNYKTINLGYFNSAEDASKAYQKARKEMFPGVFETNS